MPQPHARACTAPAKQFLARLTKLFNYEKYTCPIKRGTRYFYSHNSGAYRRGAGTRTPVRSALATTHAGGARSGHEGGRVNHAGLQAQYVLYKQDALDAPGQVLLDPNTLAADGTTSLSTYALTDGGDLLAYGVRKLKEYNVVTGGDAGKQGILTRSDARWKQTFDFMVKAGMVDAKVDYRKAYSLDLVKDVKVLP